MHQLSPRQRRVLLDYKKRSTAYRASHPQVYSLANTALRMGVATSTFRSILKTSARGGLRKHHVPDVIVSKTYRSIRSATAKSGRHDAVTSNEVSELMVVRRGSAKFKGRARMQKVAAKDPSIRKPTACPRHGHKARESQQVTYLLNHRHV